MFYFYKILSAYLHLYTYIFLLVLFHFFFAVHSVSLLGHILTWSGSGLSFTGLMEAQTTMQDLGQRSAISRATTFHWSGRQTAGMAGGTREALNM